MTKIEAKLKQMGYELPKVPMDMKYWARCKRAGNLIFMGTTGPWPIMNKTVKGKLEGVIGKDVTVEEAKFTCKMAVLSILAALKNELGDLDKIGTIVRLEVYLSGMGGDDDSYVAVADAASELFIELFGENGRATRTVTPNISNFIAGLDMVVAFKD